MNFVGSILWVASINFIPFKKKYQFYTCRASVVICIKCCCRGQHSCRPDPGQEQEKGRRTRTKSCLRRVGVTVGLPVIRRKLGESWVFSWIAWRRALLVAISCGSSSVCEPYYFTIHSPSSSSSTRVRLTWGVIACMCACFFSELRARARGMHGGAWLYTGGRRAESRFAGALRSFTPTPINASHTAAVPLSFLHALPPSTIVRPDSYGCTMPPLVCGAMLSCVMWADQKCRQSSVAGMRGNHAQQNDLTEDTKICRIWFYSTSPEHCKASNSSFLKLWFR
jgi:hypothetical protein